MKKVKELAQTANVILGRIISICLIVLLMAFGGVMWFVISASGEHLLPLDSFDYGRAVTALRLPKGSVVHGVTITGTPNRSTSDTWRIKIRLLEKNVGPYLKNSIEPTGTAFSTGWIEDFSVLDKTGGTQLNKLSMDDLIFADFEITANGKGHRGSYIYSAIDHTFWIRIQGREWLGDYPKFQKQR